MADWPYNTQRWQRLRRAKLREQPLCQRCERDGRFIIANMAQRSPSFEPAFRNLNLNQRVDASDRFINAADWEANGESFAEIELEGQRCYGGLDLSSTRDLTALALWFPDSGRLLVLAFCAGRHDRGARGTRPGAL